MNSATRRARRSPVITGAPGAAIARSRLPWHKDVRRNWPLYLMALPGVLSILIFGYGPLLGLVVAFKDYDPFLGILQSPWVGLDNFHQAFANPYFWTAVRNSVTIGILKLAVGFPSAIILALLLNEVRARWLKSVVQTATIMPFFMSWVVAAVMFQNLLAPDGAVNGVLQHGLGRQPVPFLSDPITFLWVVVLQDTWKYAGYYAVLYLAAMSAIDPVLYEASDVDGANRWQQTWHITLPGIRSTMVTLFVLLIGYLVSAGFEQIYIMYNPSVYASTDIIETFSLRLAFQQGSYGLATAIGLVQASVSLALVLVVNFLVKRFNQEGLF
jgi:ABC-type polysaccharide transport system permease subunit